MAGVDAFVQNWSNDNCLLVPPVIFIPSVWRHLYSCKAKGALVCHPHSGRYSGPALEIG